MNAITRNLKQRIKDLVEPWPLAKAMAYVADDTLMGLRLRMGDAGSTQGMVTEALSVEQSVRAIETMFADYKDLVDGARFSGRVAELGPGDSAGVALLLLGDGCERVELVDRYKPYRDERHVRATYAALAKKHGLDALGEAAGWDDHRIPNLAWCTGQAAEQWSYERARSGERYDTILSRHVLEHLYDPLGALRSMVECLRPGGRLVHQVDLHDHGMFAPRHHSLTFLEIPPLVYRRMTRNSGRPNRVLVNRYRSVLDELRASGRIDYELRVSRLVDVGLLHPSRRDSEVDPADWARAIAYVEQHRSRLSAEFASMDARDLAVSGVALLVTRR